MKKVLRNLAVVGSLLCVTPAFAANYVSVGVDNANVRSGPALNKQVVMELFKGYPLKILKNQGEWYQVEDFEKDRGWIHKKITSKKETVIVNAKNSLNMRETPSTKGKVIASVERGVVLDVLKKEGDWTNVKHSGGTVGWIYSQLLWP